MLYNGEQIGDGSPPRGRHRRRPAGGHDAHRARACRARSRSSRCQRPRHDVRPRARASTWRSSRAAPEIADLLDLDRPLGETVALVAERRGHRHPRRHGRHARPPPPRGGHQGDPRRRRARAADHRRRRRRRSLLAVSDRSPVNLLWGIGGTPEGVISSAAIKCIGGGFVGRLWPRDDDERKAALDQGYDLDRQLTQRRPRHGRRLLLLRHRRHRRRRAAGRALPRAPDGDDRVDRDALALGDGPPHPRHATTARSCARSPASAYG